VLIDTHCHLHDRQFFTEEQAEAMVKRANEKGIKRIICIGTDPEDSLAAAEFAKKHKNTYWTYGIHPEETTKEFRLGAFRSAAARDLAPAARGDGPAGRGPERNSLVAIGEVGLDYHSDGYDREAQIKLFEEMLQLAVDNDLPVSFHVRNAFPDFFAVTSNFPKVRGVVHSFTDSKKTLKKILETTDFYVGVNGLATYSTLPTPPLDRILLETDAPFLTPTPFRGIINEPGYVYEIAQWLSAKLDLDFATIEKETTKNAERLFNFSDTILR
jgi:TatD DNase family protein